MYTKLTNCVMYVFSMTAGCIAAGIVLVFLLSWGVVCAGESPVMVSITELLDNEKPAAALLQTYEAILESEDAEVIAQIEAIQNQIIAAWKVSGISADMESFGSTILSSSDLTLPEMMLAMDYFALSAEEAQTRMDLVDAVVNHDELRRIAWRVVEDYPNSVFRDHALSQYVNVHLHYKDAEQSELTIFLGYINANWSAIENAPKAGTVHLLWHLYNNARDNNDQVMAVYCLESVNDLIARLLPELALDDPEHPLVSGIHFSLSRMLDGDISRQSVVILPERESILAETTGDALVALGQVMHEVAGTAIAQDAAELESELIETWRGQPLPQAMTVLAEGLDMQDKTITPGELAFLLNYHALQAESVASSEEKAEALQDLRHSSLLFLERFPESPIVEKALGNYVASLLVLRDATQDEMAFLHSILPMTWARMGVINKDLVVQLFWHHANEELNAGHEEAAYEVFRQAQPIARRIVKDYPDYAPAALNAVAILTGTAIRLGEEAIRDMAHELESLAESTSPSIANWFARYEGAQLLTRADQSIEAARRVYHHHEVLVAQLDLPFMVEILDTEDLDARTAGVIGCIIGHAYAGINENEEAMRWYDHVLGHYSDIPNARETALFSRAEILARRLDSSPHQIITAYETFVGEFPDSEYTPDTLFRLASLYDYVGNRGKALELYHLLQSEYPKSYVAASVDAALYGLIERTE